MFVIAGASGKTGKAVADALLTQGFQVRVLARDARAADRFRARGAQVHVTSLEDVQGLQQALVGARALYALVPEEARVREPALHRRRIVSALAAAVRASRLSHVALLSSAAAVLPAGNGPSAELYFAEQELRAAASRLTILRASYFQENVLGTLGLSLQQGIYPNFFPSEELPIPMVATCDVAKVAAQCLSSPPARSEIVDIVGPAYSARQVAAALAAALDRSVHVQNIPPEDHVRALTHAGLPSALAASVAELYACFASGKIVPRGERLVAGTTTLADTLASALAVPLAQESVRAAQRVQQGGAS